MKLYEGGAVLLIIAGAVIGPILSQIVPDNTQPGMPKCGLMVDCVR